MTRGRIPLWIKIAYTLWVLVWFPLYWVHYGPSNFLWFCDIGNILIGVALWIESPLLFSMQACSVLLVQVAWTVDFLGRLVFGNHLIGGTGYMFDSGIGIGWRLLSLFHVVMPPLLFWGVKRLGHDRRGWIVQTIFGTVILVICWLGWDHTRNLNWVWGPFDRPQYWMKPWLYLIVCIAAYPVLIYFPTHLLLSRFCKAACDHNPPAAAGSAS